MQENYRTNAWRIGVDTTARVNKANVQQRMLGKWSNETLRHKQQAFSVFLQSLSKHVSLKIKPCSNELVIYKFEYKIIKYD